MSRKSDKWNFIFALIAFIFFGLFVYFYLNQPSDKVEENEHIGKSAEKKVEVIDFLSLSTFWFHLPGGVYSILVHI